MFGIFIFRGENVIKTFDNFSKIIKIILALPVLDIIWAVYRLIKSYEKKNTIGIILALILIIIGIPFLWLVDMISIIIDNKVYWID